jgi:phage terminase large subunit GpA-like protein
MLASTAALLHRSKKRSFNKVRPVPLSTWMEDNIRLPAGLAAVAGALHLHPYQRAIADAMADPAVERVSVIKTAIIC